MLEEEISVAPFFMARIDIVPEWCARVVRCAVPMQYVLLERIVWREIETAPEPPYGPRGSLCREKAHVGVRSWHVRIQGMDHERHPHRTPRRVRQLRTLHCGAGWQ